MKSKEGDLSNICIFSISDSLGGAEQVLFKIAKFYSEKQNMKISLWFFKPQTNRFWVENLQAGVEISYLNNDLILFLRKIRKRKIDIVFSSHLMTNAFLGFIRGIRLLKTNKLIVRESTQVFGRYSGLKLLKYKLAYFFGYQKIDLIVCQSQRMLGALNENVSFLFNRTKVKVIPNPFDYPIPEISNEFVEIKENTIVSAGRLIPEKGFDILIKSFSRLSKKKPEMNLVILGEGSERGKLEMLISELNLNEKVTLKGYIDNVYPYFKKAKVCVVSSIKEGFPNVLLQMMSQNERVISTDCAGGIKEIEGVLVVDTNSVESLFYGFQTILSTEVNHRELFDKELRKRAINAFINKILNELD